MAYRVNDRGDVNRKLDELDDKHDIDSVGDIRRAHGSFRHRLAHANDAGQLGLHATGSPAQLAANIEALEHTAAQLEALAGEVDELIKEAGRLATPMRDGHGPIARVMSAAFRERADDARGAVRALHEYRRELTSVILAIRQTLDGYRCSEQSAVGQLTGLGADE